jgi:NitT/TauT family transport system ATP-binding protein
MELKVDNLTKVYSSRSGDVTALTPTSFTVEAGEFICLLGPSGCGKSTLLYMLSGLEECSGGSIMLDGEPIVGPGRNLGMVFQNYTLFPWLTVKENAAFSQRLAGNHRVPPGEVGEAFDRASRVEYLLELMGLSKFKNSYPRELSGGMKQRVAIARTLVNKPKVMLMDEPFGALDSQTREEMQELLLLLTKHEKTTVIFVTHDVDEAVFLGSRVLVFSRRPGRVIADVKVPFAKNADFQVKLDPEFFKLKRELLDLLHSQAEAGADRSALLEQLIAREAK